MKLTINEFKVLVMLYVANIDGNVHPEEVEVMLEKADEVTYRKVSKVFRRMCDSEIIEAIRRGKKQYAVTEADRSRLLEDLRNVINADEHCSAMEGVIYKAVERILTSDTCQS